MKTIRTGDTVKVISGSDKGKEAKVLQVLPKKNAAVLEGIGEGTRHIRTKQMGLSQGAKRSIHVPLSLHKMKLVKSAEIKPKAATKTTKVKAKEGKK